MISVIGGGPAGFIVAREAARRGQDVTVYEEHGVVGKPVQCTGLVSRSGLDGLKVDYSSSVLNEISRAMFFSPSGQSFELEKSRGHALVIDRTAFDRELMSEAEAEGAKVVLGKRVLDFPEGFVVGADGASSVVAKHLGINRKFIIAYQIENLMHHDPDSVELHFGSFAPGFFAWVVPVDEKRVRMGLGYVPSVAKEMHDSYDPRIALKFFAKLRNYPWSPVSEQGGLIPLFDDSPTVFGRFALVGDAAAQVKASTGGGIAIGGRCAMILGEVLGNGEPLRNYEEMWRERFAKELKVHLGVHRFLSRLSDHELEDLFSEVDDEILRLISSNADMEDLSGLISPAIRYLSSHPAKAMRLMKYLRYVDRNLIPI